MFVDANLFSIQTNVLCRYVSVGDVAYSGDYSDNQTVITYRNDEGSFEKPLGFDLVRSSFTWWFSYSGALLIHNFPVSIEILPHLFLESLEFFSLFCISSKSQQGSCGWRVPKIEASGYSLQVWRNWKDGIGSSISMWMPRAPDGYVALGCVVSPDYEEPQLDTVWCVHSDLTEDAHFEETAIWKAPSEAPWHCYVYPVASEVRTFIALREEKNEDTPNPTKVVG